MNRVRGQSLFTLPIIHGNLCYNCHYTAPDWLAVWTSAHNLRHHGNKFSEVWTGKASQQTTSFMLALIWSGFGNRRKCWCGNSRDFRTTPIYNMQTLAPPIAHLINSLQLKNSSRSLIVALMVATMSRLSIIMGCYGYYRHEAWSVVHAWKSYLTSLELLLHCASFLALGSSVINLIGQLSGPLFHLWTSPGVLQVKFGPPTNHSGCFICTV